MKNWTRFNINQYVKFKPGDGAIDAYIEYFSVIPSSNETEIRERFYSNIDKDGFMVMQMWACFSIFGKHLYAGSGIIHSNEFYLETEHLTPPLPDENP